MSAPSVEPLSWRAVQWIKSLLAAVSPDTGYYNDFSAMRLLDDRGQINADDGPYVLIVASDFTSVSESTTRSRSVYREDMEVLIEFGVPVDTADAERSIHRARADVLRALRQDIRTADTGISSLQITGGTLADAPDGSALLIAQVTARASLTDTSPPAS